MKYSLTQIATGKKAIGKLGASAHRTIWTIGKEDLMDQGKILAIVGARNADEHAMELAQRVGEYAAEQEVTIISGGAKGIDRTAMLAALENNGQAIGVLPGELNGTSAKEEWRRHIESGRLLLMTPYEPDGRFTVGRAMGRNKYIYAFADAAIALGAKKDKGGTWAGAKENLTKTWTPLFVGSDTSEGSGEEALIALGARRLPEDNIKIAFDELTRERKESEGNAQREIPLD